ncbi:MAG: class I SAM-dependent methyltransferase [Chloroflexota bacterium]
MAEDFTKVKQSQQQVWPTGDYQRIVNYINLMSMSDDLCEAVRVLPHHRVLDVATGTGNTAMVAARRGFPSVTGVDFAPELLDVARARAATEGLNITFDAGDAEDLPYTDDSFNIVLSTCGVMFASDQERAARELDRVCRPGGRIGLTAWTPSGAVGEFIKCIGQYAPPPASVASPLLWGSEEHVEALFGDRVDLEIEQRSISMYAHSPEDFVESFLAHYGPAIAALNRLEPDDRQSLQRDLVQVVAGFAEPAEDSIEIAATYLEIVGAVQ